MRNDGLLTGGALFCDMRDVETCADNIVKVANDSGVKFDGVFSPHEQVCVALENTSGRPEGLMHSAGARTSSQSNTLTKRLMPAVRPTLRRSKRWSASWPNA
jgi:hypothetical protein